MSDPGSALVEMDQRPQAEQLLAAARQRGDRRKELLALTDLGILCTRGGDARRAVGLLEEALVIARQLEDKSRESDVLGYLAQAVVSVGDPARALDLLHQSLALARASGDPFAEKLGLEHLGRACSTMRQHARAIAVYDQALLIARRVGDAQHEAELVWYRAVERAELGQREQAIAEAEAAIQLWQRMEKPQAGWLADYLKQYRAGTATVLPGASVLGSGWALGASAPPEQAASPGILRMAISAVRSAAAFLRSGLKTATPQTHQQRIETCATCEHHTGLRCKLCGCFTNVKAWLPHEDCPVGKWPRGR